MPYVKNHDLEMAIKLVDICIEMVDDNQMKIPLSKAQKILEEYRKGEK